MHMRTRDKIINEACAIAAEHPDNAAINQMAEILAVKIPKMGIKSALRLLATIGLALSEQHRPSTNQIESTQE